MSLRVKLYVMCLMIIAAAFTIFAAAATLVPQNTALPEEIYGGFLDRAENAQFFIRSSNDVIAVYAEGREKKPIALTKIPLSVLRSADRAMVEKGIPVSDRGELLLLLEDLSV